MLIPVKLTEYTKRSRHVAKDAAWGNLPRKTQSPTSICSFCFRGAISNLFYFSGSDSDHYSPSLPPQAHFSAAVSPPGGWLSLYGIVSLLFLLLVRGRLGVQDKDGIQFASLPLLKSIHLDR